MTSTTLLTTIKNQGDEIEMKDKEIVRLQAKVEKMQDAENALKEKLEKPKEEKKAPAKKAAPKKAAAKKEAPKAEAPKAEEPKK